ncbi:MAG: hypothetical protein V1836_04410 [Candidatus Aenigmatarchaeota archaeon]
MRKLRTANFKVYLGPGSEYEKIINASEKAASKVEELIYRRLCYLPSLSILCSDYMKMKKAAERAFKKTASSGNAKNDAKKDYQRALRVIEDTFGQQLEYYADGVIRNQVESAGEVKKGIKNRVYHDRLPKPSWMDGLINDIKDVKMELDKTGINSKSVSKHVNAGVEKTERIKKQLEKYSHSW